MLSSAIVSVNTSVSGCSVSVETAPYKYFSDSSAESSSERCSFSDAVSSSEITSENISLSGTVSDTVSLSGTVSDVVSFSEKLSESVSFSKSVSVSDRCSVSVSVSLSVISSDSMIICSESVSSDSSNWFSFLPFADGWTVPAV